MRPVLTGWFAEFALRDRKAASGQVAYGDGGDAFAGATYDPTSHYRAAAVFRFHAEQGLTPERLRSISRHQVGLLERGIAALDIDPSRARIEPLPEERRAGFLAIRMPDPARVARALRERGRLRRCPWRRPARRARAVSHRRSATQRGRGAR